MKDTLQENINHQPAAKQKQDTYTWFYAVLLGIYCLLCILLLAFYPSLHYYLVCIFLVTLPLIGIGFLIFILPVMLLQDILDRSWRSATSKVAPIIAIVIMMWLVRLYVPLDVSWIRLQVSKPVYLVEIAIMQVPDGSPRLKTWDWGQTTVFLGGVHITHWYMMIAIKS